MKLPTISHAFFCLSPVLLPIFCASASASAASSTCQDPTVDPTTIASTSPQQQPQISDAARPRRVHPLLAKLLPIRSGGTQKDDAAASAATSSTTTALQNSALVFIKPHANTAAVQTYVREALQSKIPGVKIVSEFDISAADIDRKKLIDKHYYAIASKATILSPDKIPVPKDKFEQFFGESWDSVLGDGRAVNAMQACARFGCTASELDDAWRKAETESKVVKLGGGFYCGLLSYQDSTPPLYVFNAFFMKMRDKFVQAGSPGIHCYEIEWDASDLKWSDFRSKVLGPTDPSSAPRGSIRRTILQKYKAFGLASSPDKGDNGVHASASPFEALAEKCNWANRSIKSDAFGAALLSGGLSAKRIEALSLDPQVQLDLDDGTGAAASTSTGSVFDTLEDMDATECLEALLGMK